MRVKVGGRERKLRLKNTNGELVAAYKFTAGGREELLTVRKKIFRDSTNLEVLDPRRVLHLNVLEGDAPNQLPVGAFVTKMGKGGFSVYHREVEPRFRRAGLATRLYDLIEDHLFSRGAKHSHASTSKKSTLLFLFNRGYEPVAGGKLAKAVVEKPGGFPENLESKVRLAKPAPRQGLGKRTQW